MQTTVKQNQISFLTKAVYNFGIKVYSKDLTQQVLVAQFN